MKTNLSVKIIGLVFTLFFVLFLVISYVEFSNYTTDMTAAFVERAKATAQSLEAGVRNKEELADKDMLMSTIYKHIWLDPEIIDISFNVPSGSGLVTFISNDQTSINRTADSENLDAFNKDILVSRLGYGKTSRILKIITPMHLSGERVGTFQIDFTLENVDNRIKSTLYTTILSYAAIMVLFTFSLFLILRVIVIKPITEINKGLDAIAENNFSYRVKIKSQDEIGQLASAFNQMAEDLKKSRAQIGSHSRELETRVEGRTTDLKDKVAELTDTKTAMLNMMEDLDKSNKELMEAQKGLTRNVSELKKLDQEKDTFISIAAHELKTPMTAITGFAQLLENKKTIRDAQTRNKYFGIIKEEIKRLSKLVTEVLDLSRLDLGTMKFTMELCDVSPLLEQVRDELLQKAKTKGLKLDFHIDSSLPKIVTDKERTLQVLINLVDNAIKYSEKGTITVQAGKDKDFIKFSVADTGIGIPKEHFSKMFTRFYQVENPLTRKVGGTGLGLSICKDLVEALGGKIWFDSRIGKGSTFFFTIPVHAKVKGGIDGEPMRGKVRKTQTNMQASRSSGQRM